MALRAFTVAEIADVTSGVVMRASSSTVAGLCLDSRAVTKGVLFAALQGENADGHAFCAAAAEAGAACLLVEKPTDVPGNCGIVRVSSVEMALRSLGARVRADFRGEVVAVVGSCGKTTTKDFASALLGHLGTVCATSGNRNNLLGLPETLMNAHMDRRFWVLELGISKPNEMGDLAPIARPTGVIMTTIQPVHTEFFPTLEAIRDEKARVFDSAEPGGFAALNAEDPLLRDLRLPTGTERILYGTSPAADVRVEAEEGGGPEGTPFVLHLHGQRARGVLPLPGAYNLLNFAGACSAGAAFGADAQTLASAASQLRPASHRGQTHRLAGDVLLLDDSYNANPSAMAAVLAETALWGRPVAGALGEMLELGPATFRHHTEAGRAAAEAGLTALLAVGGEAAGAMAEAFAASGRPVLHVRTWREGTEWLEGQILPGSGVVVKGSRGIGLDGLVAWLVERRGA